MSTKFAERQFGTGGLKRKKDLRDRRYKKVAYAVTPFDWDKGYDIETELAKRLGKPEFRMPVKDQNGSLSCGGQAGAYYEEVHDAFEKGVYIERSARDGYSQVRYPGGGTTTRDILNLIVKNGICKESLMPSYFKGGYAPDEAFMMNRKDASDITVADAKTAKGTAYAFVGNTIDEFAQAIRDNKGLVFIIDGEDNGTWRSIFPKPPKKMKWRHLLYAGKAKLINGVKHIGFINSWSEETGDHGWQWINEDYFKKGFVDDAGVVYDSPEDAQNAVNGLMEKLLELLQKVLNSLRGSDTKVILH